MTDLIMLRNLARQRVVSACGYYHSYVMLLFAVWHASSEALPLGIESLTSV